MNELTLSIWIMDDGGYTGEGVRISANCFTYLELERLKKILRIHFDLDCTIKTVRTLSKGRVSANLYSIYIKKNSLEKLRALTLPHIHKSMWYKLGLK